VGQRTFNVIRRTERRREILEKMLNMKKLLTGLVAVGLGFAGTTTKNMGCEGRIAALLHPFPQICVVLVTIRYSR